MRNFVFGLLITFISIGYSFGQQTDSRTPPDWQKIEYEVNSPTSPYYYPPLMERYAVGDTTLNFEEYFYLYYGYTFQPEYKPLLSYPESDSLSELFSRRITPTYETFVSAAKFAQPLLEKNPFSLRDINMLAYAYENLDQLEAAAREMRKLTMLKSVITSTGYGLEQETPWYITLATNAHDIVALMGLEVVNEMISGPNIEFLQVRKMPDSLKQFKGYYFEFSPIYKRKPDYLDEQPKEKRRMEINGTRPWELGKKR